MGTLFEEARSRMAICAADYTYAESRRDDALIELRKVCPHTDLLEAPWFENYRYHPSIRCCETCGLKEEYPFRTLTGQARKVAGDHMLCRAQSFIKTRLTYEETLARGGEAERGWHMRICLITV